MSAAEKQRLITFRLHTFLTGVIILLLSLQAQTMTPLEEEEMAGVSGAGLAFAFDDFRFQMAPTSFFEQLGAMPQGGTVFNRGDLRWIGTTLSRGSATSDGSGMEKAYAYHDWLNPTGASSCSTATSLLGCPIGVGGIDGYVEVNNPYVLRVREHEGVGWNGSNWQAGFKNSVVELVGATNSEPFRWSFWGEIDVFNGPNDTDRIGKLQNQEIIIGAPVSRLNPNGGDDKNNIVGPVFQMYSNRTNVARNERTLGMLYHHRLSGDYRFSVHQNGPDIAANGSMKGNAPWGAVPHFTDQEGMYFTNVNTYLPLGQLHYQSMVIDGTPDGNFFLELTRIPDEAVVYDDFYATSGTGFLTSEQRWSSDPDKTGRSERYYQTHGYARWGDGFPQQRGNEESGVSKVRFSGIDPDGPTKVINQANYPCSGGNCANNYPGVNGGTSWNRWAGYTAGYAVETWIVNENGVRTPGKNATRKDVREAGGMSFLSSSEDSYWNILNNPTKGRNDNLYMLWVQNGELQKDARYIDGSNDQNYNPMLNVNGINLGSSRAEGMLIQHLKITSLGAAAP